MIVGNLSRRAGLAVALGSVLLLCAGPAVLRAQTAAPADSAASTATVPDYSSYQKLLDEFLINTSVPGGPLETAFNYEAMFLQLDRNDRLDAIHKQITAVPPSRMTPEVRKAWAINLYNFLVIENIVYHIYVGPGGVTRQAKSYLVKRRTASVQEIRIQGGKFFETPVVEIEGVKYSLDQFERHFLFADFDRGLGKATPTGLDPRLHFATVCGSKSCPPLQPKVYQAETLDQQLDGAVRNAFANPRQLRWDPDTGLIGSMLFVWYGADFGGPDKVMAFVRRYAPPATVERMDAANTTSFANFTPWDWKYNEPADKSSGAMKPAAPGKRDS